MKRLAPKRPSAAQSIARKLWADGIHVAYLVLDGVVNLPRMREMMSDKPTEFFLSPEAIADSVLALVRQDRQAWTFELDLRPSVKSGEEVHDGAVC